MDMNKKLKIGWFTFSCSEDSTIIFTELLNDHYRQWRQMIDFKAFLRLQKKEEIEDLDVSFIEGAIISANQEEKLKKIRLVSKKIVAVGACAVVGMPSGQRNFFAIDIKEEITPILTRFKYAPMVKKISDIVIVDDQVPGCPMDEDIFLKILEKYFLEFGITGVLKSGSKFK